jgi:phage terminase small subunit
MDTPLTDKQAAFAREYVKDFNGTQAAIRAGYSPKSARVQAVGLLAKPNIKGEVQRLRDSVESAAIISYHDTCVRMSDIVRDPQDPFASIKAADRLAQLRGWDQPAKVQTEDVTPPRYDLSKLTDEELAGFEALLSKVTPT